MSEKWDTPELYGKVQEALGWAYGEAVIDDEVGIESGDGMPILVQYDTETNEVVARFEIEEIKFRQIIGDAEG